MPRTCWRCARRKPGDRHRPAELDQIHHELADARSGPRRGAAALGDPSIYSAPPNMPTLDALGIDYEIVRLPAFAAASTVLGRELTVPGSRRR